MQFENNFEVASPIETVWDTLLNVEEVAPCMPGAEVLEQTGDNSYKVAIKVRLGPVSMQYRGDVEIVDPDPSAHQARMVAKATEARGQGTANAEIGMRLEEQDGKTRAVLTTDLRLSGRAAAMGQGIVKDVAGKLTETFAECLATKLEGAPSGNGGAAAETEAGWSPSSGATRVSERETTAPAPASSEGGAEEERDVSGVLEREDVEAATSGFTTPERADSLETQPDVPGDAPEGRDDAPTTKETEQLPPAPRATPEVAAELPALEIAASVVADRLRKPGVLAGAVAAVFVVGFAIGRLGR
jgi:uncharacterized protein